MKALRVLHLEDSPLDSELIVANLQEGGIEVEITRVDSEAAFLYALENDTFDLILADYSLPMFDGLTALRIMKEQEYDLPFILVSGALGEDVAIESLKSAATDYVLKHRLDRLAPSVVRALRESQERADRQRMEEELRVRAVEVADLNTRLQRAMAESHHRIKNNLQVLSALVDMQIFASSDGTVPISELQRLSQHIRTLGALHDLLTQESKSTADLDSVSIDETLRKLAPMLETASGGRKIVVDTAGNSARIPVKQGSPFIFLVNELVSNAIKHGAGTVAIRLRIVDRPREADAPAGQLVRLEVCDDGPGFPPNFDPKQSANTGLELIESMGRWDLGGELLYENPPGGGARVVVTFPLDPAR
jgi:two-component sensor histidine kinase